MKKERLYRSLENLYHEGAYLEALVKMTLFTLYEGSEDGIPEACKALNDFAKSFAKKVEKHKKQCMKFYNEVYVDKQINKIKKDLDHGEKDTKRLLKMDKKQDKKLAACDKKMKKKAKK